MKAFWVLIGGVLAVGTAQRCVAQAGARSPVDPVRQLAPAVEVRVGCVVGSNSGQYMDPQLQLIGHQLRSLFPYRSYRLLKEESQQVPWGGRAGFDLPGGRYVLVIPRGFREGRIAMKVMVIEGARPIVDTSLALRRDARLLVGGPRQANGVLILTIGAEKLDQE